MTPDEALTATETVAIFEENLTEDSHAERSPENPLHSREWHMPGGWVVPGIVHPDDTSEYLAKKRDIRRLAKFGLVRASTRSEMLALFEVAALRAESARAEAEASTDE